MLNHDPRPHPTLYEGRRYRSRLEARWAAFFDLLGWPFEYEPYDLGAWSPDFLLHGDARPILAEVKPITEKDDAVCAKMAAAASATDFQGELLLLGVSPVLCPSRDMWLGWLDDGADPWFDCIRPEDERKREDEVERTLQELRGEPSAPLPAFHVRHFGACLPVRAKNGRFDFCHPVNAFMGRMTGAWDGDHYVDPTIADDVDELWRKASNLVQWRGR